MNKGQFTFQDFKHDFLASVVVFLVALPLCMGIAIASGAPPAAGLITGIIGGFVVGSLAGSPLLVSGPAAGLAVIVWDIIQTYGIETLGLIVLLAGFLQVLASVFKLGQWFRAVSPAVIHGMLAGIGILIFASQFHVMVDDLPKGSGLDNILTLEEAVWKGLRPGNGPELDHTHYIAARIGVLTIVIILLWSTVIPKKLRVIPAPLVGVAVASLEAALQDLQIKYVSIPDNLFSDIQVLGVNQLGGLLDPSILMAAAALAFVASVETLLSATAVDQIHSGPRTDYNRELWAQGAGNLVSGLLGALPITGVIVRGSANVQAGARTRASAILHGAWILLFVAFLPNVLEYVPTASLAAVLVFTGYKLMNVHALRELKKFGWGEVTIYAATVITIVVKDLMVGVILGVVLATVKLVYTFAHLKIQTITSPDGKRITLRLIGSATFLSLPKLAEHLEQIAPGIEVHVHFEGLTYIDHACLDLLNNWEKQYVLQGGIVSFDWKQLENRYYQPPGSRPSPTS